MLDITDIRKILDQLSTNTRTEYIKISTKVSEHRLGLTESKFGGFPYWPRSKATPTFYPHSANGRPLTMLAQINLADLQQNDVFPNTGILQFFILNAVDSKNYEVVFHKDIEEPVVFASSGPIVPTSLMPARIEVFSEAAGKRIVVQNSYWGDEGFPVTGELSLEFSLEYETANLTENCFHEEFKKAAEQLHIPIPEIVDSVEYLIPLSQKDRDELFGKYYIGDGHKLLGRPYFIQYDYRDSKTKNDILLFQIDSLLSDSGETDENNFISLGDAGTAGFFISPEDLKNLDFSRVYYEWASC